MSPGFGFVTCNKKKLENSIIRCCLLLEAILRGLCPKKRSCNVITTKIPSFFEKKNKILSNHVMNADQCQYRDNHYAKMKKTQRNTKKNMAREN